MSDIVERLREGVLGSGITKTDTFLHSTMQEAADEIEKLRAALREIKKRTQYAHPMTYVADYWRIANEALGEKE